LKKFTNIVIILICLSIIVVLYYVFGLKQDTKQEIKQEIKQEENVNIANNTILENTSSIENVIEKEEKEEIQIPKPKTLTSANGDKYSYIGTIKIKAINLNMKITSKTTEELMRKSACKLWGADPNTVGNLCLIGHNWRNTKLFSKVPTLKIGDTIDITDLSGRTLIYKIYEKYTVHPENTECLEQETEGRKEVTLITCTNDGKKRYVLHAKQIIEK